MIRYADEILWRIAEDLEFLLDPAEVGDLFLTLPPDEREFNEVKDLLYARVEGEKQIQPASGVMKIYREKRNFSDLPIWVSFGIEVRLTGTTTELKFVPIRFHMEKNDNMESYENYDAVTQAYVQRVRDAKGG